LSLRRWGGWGCGCGRAGRPDASSSSRRCGTAASCPGGEGRGASRAWSQPAPPPPHNPRPRSGRLVAIRLLWCAFRRSRYFLYFEFADSTTFVHATPATIMLVPPPTPPIRPRPPASPLDGSYTAAILTNGGPWANMGGARSGCMSLSSAPPGQHCRCHLPVIIPANAQPRLPLYGESFQYLLKPFVYILC